MQLVECKNWHECRDALGRYAKLPRGRRDEFWFRGMGSSKWSLTTTLDRRRDFENDADRALVIDRLLREFQRHAVALGQRVKIADDTNAIEFLARHHGLPSPLLDWSRSPYVACYFAFAAERGEEESEDDFVLWALDMSAVNIADLAKDIEFINPQIDLLYENYRAIRQRGVFLRVLSIRQTVEELLGKALFQFVIPANCKKEGLSELDEMLLNEVRLSTDLTSAARATTLQVLELADDDF